MRQYRKILKQATIPFALTQGIDCLEPAKYKELSGLVDKIHHFHDAYGNCRVMVRLSCMDFNKWINPIKLKWINREYILT